MNANTRGPVVVPWTLCALAVAMNGAAAVLMIAAHARTGNWELAMAGWPTLLVVPFIAPAAALLIARRPRNPAGWLLAQLALGLAIWTLTAGYVTHALRVSGSIGTSVRIAGLIDNSIWPVGVNTPLLLLILLFPTGRPLSARWRPLVWAIPTIGVVALGGTLPVKPELWGGVPSPVPWAHAPAQVIASVVFPAMGLCALLTIAAMVVRYVRADDLERHQLKWFVLAALPWVVALVEGGSRGKWGALEFVLTALSFAGIPAAIAIAILRYRLYDIDVVISKTVVYGGLAAFITAVYVGVVVGIGALVGAGDKPNLGLSLAATAIVAVAFQPVRERVQRFANKLVYGERVTPYEAITRFSHRMAESLSLDLVLPQMAEAAARGVAGVRSRVKLLLPAGAEQVVTWPDGANGDSFDRTLAVVHQGEEMGEIAVAKAPGEQINSSEEKLLTDLASQAGLAMRNLRLTAELQQKLVELQASRQRIVKAQDEERRRMERDIHDGAQQQLVSMSVKLGLVRNLLSRDAQKAGEVLEELRGEVSEAVETLRDLARGLFPEILTERGIKSALESHIARMDLNATVVGESGRFGAGIEANVYFCIREALQNASKHAPGAPVVVSLAVADGQLSVTVKDEGPGFDVNKTKTGSGLQNMADRVEALGGTFEIRSGAGVGTEVAALIPSRVLDEALT